MVMNGIHGENEIAVLWRILWMLLLLVVCRRWTRGPDWSTFLLLTRR
jgi:hypothetical protein